MKRQTRADRMDESLGMRRGKESEMKQSYKDRRDESEGMRKRMDHDRREERGSRVRELRDNMHAFEMYDVSSDAEKEGQRIEPYRAGKLGYSAEAWDYKY